jgi:hypothetical protein
MSKWISTADYLPPLNTTVGIRNEHMNIEIRGHFGVRGWCVIGTDGIEKYCDIPVTHWKLK